MELVCSTKTLVYFHWHCLTNWKEDKLFSEPISFPLRATIPPLFHNIPYFSDGALGLGLRLFAIADVLGSH
jgi:hypothetical protein